MKQIIIIGWWSCFTTKEAFYKSLEIRDYNPFEIKKKWKNRIAEQLKETHQTMIPEMPCKQNADYIAWKIRFERHLPFLNWEDSILIWHSQWWVFLAKWLSENNFPKKIKQLHLVSAVFDDLDLDEETIGNFNFNPDQLINLSRQTENIFLYHSKDDDIVPFIHFEKFVKYLPGAICFIANNRGHFQQEEFPELLKNIKSE
jgi:uncharacterized protein